MTSSGFSADADEASTPIVQAPTTKATRAAQRFASRQRVVRSARGLEKAFTAFFFAEVGEERRELAEQTCQEKTCGAAARRGENVQPYSLDVLVGGLNVF